MRIIFSTHNQGKVKEMQAILNGLGIEILSADEVGLHDDVEEDGSTLEENALKKARFVTEKTGDWAMADDTGLFINALNGQPGIYSARWAGVGATGPELVAYTLAKLKEMLKDQRGAYFESVVALVASDLRHWFFKGRALGHITQEPRGTPRPKLPYDQIFLPDGYDKTFAELSDAEKNQISHRGLAFQVLRDFLQSNQFTD